MNRNRKIILLVACIIGVFSLTGCNKIKQTEESKKTNLVEEQEKQEEKQEIQENNSNNEELEQVQDYIQPHNDKTEDNTKLQEKEALANILQEELDVKSYNVYCKTYDYEVDGEIQYSVPYFHIIGLDEPSIEEKINEVLLQAAIEWLEDNCLWASNSLITVTCQTEDYFSYIYRYDMNDHIFGTYCYGVTIDLKKGIRLSLDDFLTIDDTFMKQVAAYDYNDEFVFPLSVEESKTMIESARMTELEYLEENGSDVEYVMGPLKYKSSFYVKPGDLVIIRDTYGMDNIYYSKIQME